MERRAIGAILLLAGLVAGFFAVRFWRGEGPRRPALGTGEIEMLPYLAATLVLFGLATVIPDEDSDPSVWVGFLALGGVVSALLIGVVYAAAPRWLLPPWQRELERRLEAGEMRAPEDPQPPFFVGVYRDGEPTYLVEGGFDRREDAVDAARAALRDNPETDHAHVYVLVDDVGVTIEEVER